MAVLPTEESFEKYSREYDEAFGKHFQRVYHMVLVGEPENKIEEIAPPNIKKDAYLAEYHAVCALIRQIKEIEKKNNGTLPPFKDVQKMLDPRSSATYTT